MITSDFTKQDYTDQDFLRLIEHRIRKELRLHASLSTKKSYRLAETKSMQSYVLAHFLQQIFQERLSLNGDSIIETDYLELFISKRLDVFLQGSKPDLLGKKILAPLRSVTEHEIQEVARILSLSGTFEPVQQEIVDALQQKYPQTKPSFLKSFNNIENLTKK